MSGPVLDRIDLQLRLPAVAVNDLMAAGGGEPSLAIRRRVLRARDAQRERLERRVVAAECNTSLGPSDLTRVCALDPAGAALLRSATEKLGLSARAYTKVLRVARTIADLDGADAVSATAVAEAIQLRLPARRAGREEAITVQPS